MVPFLMLNSQGADYPIPTMLGERYSQTIPIIWQAAPFGRCELPLLVNFWTNSVGPLYQSFLWGSIQSTEQ